jgi:hypothetical protein
MRPGMVTKPIREAIKLSASEIGSRVRCVFRKPASGLLVKVQSVN